MSSERKIEAEMENLRVLKEMARAYARISSFRMKKTRDLVLYKRDFLMAIEDIFQDLRYSYRRQVEALARKRRSGRGGRITFLAHNGKTVAAFLSANAGLYGDIVQRTFDLFVQEVKKQEVEATLIGKMGLSMYLSAGIDAPYTYFDLPDWGWDQGQLSKIISHLVQYERVVLYYGRFDTLVSQKPAMFDVSAETSLEGKDQKERPKYYFEPSLEELLKFFESEMFAALVEQVVRESQLSKLASRMLSMDRADQNIGGRLGKTERRWRKLKHQEANRKQVNRLLSMRLW